MNARLIASGVCLALVSTLCSAQVPAVMNYQGRLVHGTNLYNGAVGLSLQLWSAATGGSLLGEDSNTVTVVDGLYATVLGDDMPADSLARVLNDNTNVYVRVLVNGAALAPRERLASAAYAVIPGLKGVGNVQAGVHSAVGGGETNVVYGAASVIGGGLANLVGTNAREAVIGGGSRNQIETEASWAVIGGGSGNRIVTQSYCSVIGGGAGNSITTLCAYSVIGGGWSNKIRNYADYAAIPGGQENEVGGDFALAAGRRAKAGHQGSFVWADSTDADFSSTANNQFLIRAAGGVGIGTNATPAMLTVAGSVQATSLSGDGSALTALNGQNLQAGSISNAALGVGSVRGTNLAASSIGPDKLAQKYWEIGGNNNVTAGVHFVGTSTTNPLELRVANARVMRFENASVDGNPNIVGGFAWNSVSAGRSGAVVAGGGSILGPNQVLDNFGAVGGGEGNTAGDNTSKDYATVAGGEDNRAAGGWSTIPGGSDNRASGFYSFAAGRRAKAVDDGAFVWADSTDADFSSTADDQFLVRAAGGVGLNEDSPRQQLSIGNYLDLYSGASNAPSQPSIRASSRGNLFLNATNDTYINYDSGRDLIVNMGGGRVGIGTGSPAHALSVAGDAQITGVVWADSFVGDGSGLTDIDGANIMDLSVTTNELAQSYWRLDGNANAAGGHFLGTIQAVPLDLYAYNTRVLRLGLNANVLGGYEANTVGGGANGATVAGGGSASLPNHVVLNYGTVGGGQGNTAGGVEATVAGGKANAASGTAAVVSGGRFNVAAGDVSAVGGGTNNRAAGVAAVVGGGRHNEALGTNSTVSGGMTNRANGFASTIAGGVGNIASGEFTAIGGGTNNLVDHDYSTVAGGRENVGTMAYIFIGGGYKNIVDGDRGTIGGGQDNFVASDNATIGGGFTNRALGKASTVGGGSANTAVDDLATVGGGQSNVAWGAGSVVGGGMVNQTRDGHNTIAGGWANVTTGDYSSVGGGLYCYAMGQASTVPGGQENEARGDHSFAAGFRAKATNDGAFVWADSQNIDLDSLVDDSVTFRCLGGVRFLTGAGGANQMVSWTPGAGAWLFTSDRETKEGWTPVDTRAVLEKLADLPITEWNYKGYPQRHVGPTAQDFHAAFPFSDSDTMLNGLDLDGVSLAAIQGLYEVVKEENARLRGENEELRNRLSALEQKLGVAPK